MRHTLLAATCVVAILLSSTGAFAGPADPCQRLIDKVLQMQDLLDRMIEKLLMLEDPTLPPRQFEIIKQDLLLQLMQFDDLIEAALQQAMEIEPEGCPDFDVQRVIEKLQRMIEKIERIIQKVEELQGYDPGLLEEIDAQFIDLMAQFDELLMQLGILPVPCPPDLNGDGVVNGLDLAILLGQWTGPFAYVPCPPFKPADFNEDCRINGLDLAILLGAWGPCP